MQLTKFSVSNFKVFKDKFEIDFNNDSIAILTGRNNTGKSTILEAIYRFFQTESKPKTISSDSFSDKRKEIIMHATFQEDDGIYQITKKYSIESAPKFYKDDKEIKKNHSFREKFEEIIENKPFYITPSMLPDDINNLIQEIYAEILKGDLENLERIENMDEETEEDEGIVELAREYSGLKKAYPLFLKKLKEQTDEVLIDISSAVSSDLNSLFSTNSLSLNVIGGESEGFSSSEILKSTNSSVNIDKDSKTGMPLSNQGTGLQRMSLIYLIQNMISKQLMGGSRNKLLLIDEPEAFLHPEAVRALSRSLYEIGEEMPLMVSTHSPILINLSENHTSIQVFRVGENEAIQLYQSHTEQFDENDIKNMRILNYVDSYINEFFFSENIVIVEGDTEYIAFNHYSQLTNKNLHIIRARGKSTICTLMKILNQFNSRYTVLHDIDNKESYSLPTLKSQLTNCKNIYQLKGENVDIITSINNFETAIGIGEVKGKDKTRTIYEIINDEKGEYSEAKQKVENLFNCIVSNNVGEIENSGGFRYISGEEEYEQLFKPLLEVSIQKADVEDEVAVTNNRLFE
ncbi:ATP-dependent nuclease [Alkalibacillus silvisoli]|uniref:ATP-dependent endonuclease n=1 Tax=Alkalibacillus silvisoli TaxID=392823 RepID=A0ABN0ZKS4_9BACI